MNKYFKLLTKCVLGLLLGVSVYFIIKASPVALSVAAAGYVILKAGKEFLVAK